MEKRSAAPRKLGRVCLVLEVQIPASAPLDWVTITQSIPGRDGTLTRTWILTNHRFDDSTFEDLYAFTANALVTAFEQLGGVQQTLQV